MSHRKGGGGTVVCFVGNIPYDTTEEQLTEIFSTVGPVQAFRLVFDRDTGKPKGYGFCEFFDPETAASAVRNLNNYDMGGRTLRVDFAENEKPSGPRDKDDGARGAGAFQPGAFGVAPGAAAGYPAPSPMGGSPAATADPIVAKALALFTNEQLMDLMAQMKLLASNNPDNARALLQQNPPLAYALFQIMLVTNMIDSSVVQQTLQHQAPVPSPMAPAVGMAARPPMPPVPGPAFVPAGVVPAPVMAPSMPPAYGAPPAVPGVPPGFADPQQAMLIQQVLSLTQQQIDALPPQERATVLQLKARLMNSA